MESRSLIVRVPISHKVLLVFAPIIFRFLCFTRASFPLNFVDDFFLSTLNTTREPIPVPQQQIFFFIQHFQKLEDKKRNGVHRSISLKTSPLTMFSSEKYILDNNLVNNKLLLIQNYR